jgi:hypothetical protein
VTLLSPVQPCALESIPECPVTVDCGAEIPDAPGCAAGTNAERLMLMHLTKLPPTNNPSHHLGPLVSDMVMVVGGPGSMMKKRETSSALARQASSRLHGHGAPGLLQQWWMVQTIHNTASSELCRQRQRSCVQQPESAGFKSIGPHDTQSFMTPALQVATTHQGPSK